MADDEELIRAIAEARTETGRRRYREVMVSDAPHRHAVPRARRRQLGVRRALGPARALARDRRLVTLACVAAAAVDEPIQQHVYAALAAATSRARSSRRSCCTSCTTRAGRARRRSRWPITGPSPASTPTPAPPRRDRATDGRAALGREDPRHRRDRPGREPGGEGARPRQRGLGGRAFRERASPRRISKDRASIARSSTSRRRLLRRARRHHLRTPLRARRAWGSGGPTSTPTSAGSRR